MEGQPREDEQQAPPVFQYHQGGPIGPTGPQGCIGPTGEDKRNSTKSKNRRGTRKNEPAVYFKQYSKLNNKGKSKRR